MLRPGLLRCEEGAGRESSDSVGDDTDLGPAGQGSVASGAAKLTGHLDEEVRAVATPDVAGTAVGVCRDDPVRPGATGGDERTAFAETAESQCFEPLQGDVGES